MALERELHNAQAEMSVGCIQGEVCTAGRVKHYFGKRWHVRMLLLGRPFGLAPISTASMGHAFGYSRVFTAAVWFCMTFFALPLDSTPAFRTTLSHGFGYSRMFIAAV